MYDPTRLLYDAPRLPLSIYRYLAYHPQIQAAAVILLPDDGSETLGRRRGGKSRHAPADDEDLGGRDAAGGCDLTCTVQ